MTIPIGPIAAVGVQIISTVLEMVAKSGEKTTVAEVVALGTDRAAARLKLDAEQIAAEDAAFPGEGEVSCEDCNGSGVMMTTMEYSDVACKCNGTGKQPALDPETPAWATEEPLNVEALAAGLAGLEALKLAIKGGS